MGCGCKKREPVVVTPVAIVTERPSTQEEIKLMDDFYNNIDEITPIVTPTENNG
jgi:hypothetical protein